MTMVMVMMMILSPLEQVLTTMMTTMADLIFVTDTTDGVCVKKKLPGVNFYRFNAKNWQFTV